MEELTGREYLVPVGKQIKMAGRGTQWLRQHQELDFLLEPDWADQHPGWWPLSLPDCQNL